MTLNYLLLGTVLSCSLLSNNAFKNGPTNPHDRPNIIFIFADDLGYGDLSFTGNDEVSTPNIDKLASEGRFCTQFHVTSGVSSPSRTSIITGLFPARLKVHGHFAGNDKNAQRGMPDWLDENLDVYLPRMMQSAGYVTAHFGKWHLGGGGLPNGDLSAPEPKKYGYDETRVWNGNGPTWNGDKPWPTTRYMDNDTTWIINSSRIAVDATIDFLKRYKNQDKPVFINLWLKDPHTPLCPSAEQRKPYSNKGLVIEKEIYYSVLTDADHHVGRLMKAIKKMGLDENTIIIFSSDNGPADYPPAKIAGSTAGLKGRKTHLFQGGVNVPFIIRWKNKVTPGVIDSTSLISSVDLLPTFCHLTGAKLPANYEPDGENIACLFSNKPFKRTKPLYWDWRFPILNKNHPNSWVTSAIRDGDWKLLRNSDNSRIELYNITNDRFEINNLACEEPNIVETLMKKLDTWQKELP